VGGAVTLGYYVEVSDPFGVKLAQLDSFVKLEYARAVNDYGTLTVDLDPDGDVSLYRLDGRLGVWRDSGQGYRLDTETVWLIRKWQRVLSESGERRLRITAYSAGELLQTRIVAYAAGSAQADKTDHADDMIKAIVRENLGSLATASRDLSALLSVQADAGLGYSMSKAFSRRNVLTVLQEIAETSAESGVPLFFDVVTPTAGALEFRTYTNQRGVDRTMSGPAPMILAPERGSIASGDLIDDYSGEITVVYAAGQGEGDKRSVRTSQDTTRLAASPFNRREYLRDARHVEDPANLVYEGASALHAGRPRRLFTSRINDTTQLSYGEDWRWGDKVTVQYEGQEFDCHVSAVKVAVSEGAESIDAALRTEELI
jgi:hypothetical protein